MSLMWRLARMARRSPLEGRDGTVQLWDTETWEPKHTLTGHTNNVKCIVFSPDSKTLASTSADKTVQLWDTETGENKYTLTVPVKSILWVLFSPDSKTLASASADKTVAVVGHRDG